MYLFVCGFRCGTKTPTINVQLTARLTNCRCDEYQSMALKYKVYSDINSDRMTFDLLYIKEVLQVHLCGLSVV